MHQKIQNKMGLWRSLIIYYGLPFRAARLTNFYRAFIKRGDLCFDIGAHVGNRTQAWTKLGAKVVALEPQPNLMQFLQQRFNKQSDVILLEKAVGAVSGQTNLYISRLTPTVSTLSPSWIDKVRQDTSFSQVKWDETVPVQVTTLDQLIEQYGLPKICKIDVEGYELEVLQGLSHPVPFISFEFIPAAIDLAFSCLNHLSQIGRYEFNWLIGENYKFPSQNWLTSDQMADQLYSQLSHGRSGDIYARQKQGK